MRYCSQNQTKSHRYPIAAVWCFLPVLLIFVAACSGDKADQKKKAPDAVPVKIGQAISKTVPIQLEAIGNVEALTTVSIKSRVVGQLKKIHIQEGQFVNQGDSIFTLDPGPGEAALKEAQARLDRDQALITKAEEDLRRYSKLFTTRAVAKEQLDQAKSNYDALVAAIKADKASIDNARLQLSYCYIYAPITGKTGSLSAFAGNMIKNNEDNPMVVINQIQPIYVSFSVPEQYLTEIMKFTAKGPLKVEAKPPQSQDPPFEGTIAFIDNSVDTRTGTIRLKGKFANEEKMLWPGQFVNVALKLTSRPNAVVIPSQAVQTGQSGEFIFVLRPDQTVEVRQVTVGKIQGREAVIYKGVQPGETVITEGQLRLVPGARVEIKNPTSPTRVDAGQGNK
ncbi:MAG: efflux RND transporter periplasmic adaptor subunit [Deltaproteobacteria bacterium]|nr:efflux RND transporter periplasmic adaptor subunit [Deltaproteobacteria bacterium]